VAALVSPNRQQNYKRAPPDSLLLLKPQFKNNTPARERDPAAT